MFKTITMEAAGSPHNIGDVLHIDGDRWVVVKSDFNGSWSKIWLDPLFVFVTRSTYCAQIPENDLSILDYINKLCDEYEESCCC
jgi:hypothetical protein